MSPAFRRQRAECLLIEKVTKSRLKAGLHTIIKVMKEDYLWNKTGEDAEIERLENALKAFRYQETAPPILPKQVFVVEKEKPRRFFQFGFAFAAFATVVVIFFAVWFQVSPVTNNIVENNEPKRDDKVADKAIIKESEVTPVKVIESKPRFNRSNVIKTRQTVAPVIRPNNLVARNNKIKEPAETLTAEEKYAYNQLMLALSITGSSLKIVKDKVRGIEEKTAVLKTAK